MIEINSASINRLVGITVLTLPPGPIPDKKFGRTKEIAEPNQTPRSPPTSPTNPELSRNIIIISKFLAPIAFITPIYLVFSRTEVNIVLAIPTAPTSNETAAMAPKNRVKVSVTP